MDITALIVTLIIGAIAGWLAGVLVEREQVSGSSSTFCSALPVRLSPLCYSQDWGSV